MGQKEYHFLFTGVGRRVELIQAFRSAALNFHTNLKIYGADVSETAPALSFCDYTRKVCTMSDEQYIPQLLQICQQDRIDLLIPTIDTDLLILAKNSELFNHQGTKILISKLDKIEICRDKNCTAAFFESCGLKTPSTFSNYRKYHGSYPCFIKPKDGSSSINAFKVNGKTELEVHAKEIADYIVQPFIEGVEYTVDIFCDFEGNPIYITPRVRMAVRSGEVLKTCIDLDQTIIAECKRLVEAYKPCGPLTVQLIRQKDTGEDYFIEINPRFGGGAPLSMKAGARSAEAILRILSGEKPEYQHHCIEDGVIYSRFDQSVCVGHDCRQALSGEQTQPIKGVIFDLDDTLYSEKQYVKSGFRAVAEQLSDKDAEEELWGYFLEGKSAIDELIKAKNIPERKAECLETYRNHIPVIGLYDGVRELVLRFRQMGIKVGLITDGRVNGQKNKISVLGLTDLLDDIIITDELGGVQFRKPNDIAFRIMQCRWGIPFEQMVYVGDNLRKDFQAPRQLGMKSIYFRNKDGLYQDNSENGVLSCGLADCVIERISDMNRMQLIFGGISLLVM